MANRGITGVLLSQVMHPEARACWRASSADGVGAWVFLAISLFFINGILKLVQLCDGLTSGIKLSKQIP